MPDLEPQAGAPKGWYDRGYLPHYDGGQVIQFITFRLADSLPKTILDALQLKLERELISEIEYHRAIDKYLDGGHGKPHLANTKIADIVEENLLRFDGERYKLHAWVIMPNHVHLLLAPRENHSLASILHSMKSYTSNRANEILKRTGPFWSKEYFDRFIRNYDHYEKTVAYVHNNPVKAGLCAKASDWRFGSARLSSL